MISLKEIRNDFPMFKNNPDLVYLDSAATSFKPQVVIDAVSNVYYKYNANIHRGDYDLSYQISKEYDDVRKKVARFINADSEREIIFTSGTSASINLIALAYVKHNLKEGDEILLSKVDHASNLLPWFEIAKELSLSIKYIELNDDATINYEKLESCFSNKTKIIALAHVSNVMGYINDLKYIVSIAKKYNTKVVIDAAQSAPHLKIDVKELDIDFLALSAHKMLGPSGVGVLYGKMENLKQMKPATFGGGANARFNCLGEIIFKHIPFCFEPGTPNIEGVIGFGAALDYLEEIGMDNIYKHDEELLSYALNELKKNPKIEIINPKADISIISFRVKDIFSQDVSAYLNSLNIALRAGNHCAKILVDVIGVADSIRMSLYFYNNKEDIDRLLNALKIIDLDKCIGVSI